MSETEYGPIVPRRYSFPRIIGLVGQKGSGKSTASAGLSRYRVCPFAEPLKKMLSILGVPYDCLYGPNKEQPLDILYGRSARYAIQTLGTTWGREMIGNRLWLDAWWRGVKTHMVGDRVQYIVVDDVRFLNEAEFLREKGAVLIKVVRPGLVVVDDHVSETEQAKIGVDGVIVNNSTPEELGAALSWTLKRLWITE